VVAPYFQSSASVSSSNENNKIQQEQQQQKKNDEHIKKCLKLQTLSCSMCLKMKQIVNDEILPKECQDCCSNELRNENEKYELIALEIDKKYLKNNVGCSRIIDQSTDTHQVIESDS
jgi:hypothetical protein